MIIFCSDEQLQVLSTCQMIFMDGTFKTTPRLWSQVYLIKGQIRRGENLFLAAVMLKSKSAETYTAMLRRLKVLVLEKTGRNFRPTTIMSDFESGLMPAVRQELGESQHKGCFFHFSQALLRFVKQPALYKCFFLKLFLKRFKSFQRKHRIQEKLLYEALTLLLTC